MSPTAATKVLIIGYVWPEPRSSAAGGHMMQILQSFLDQGWDLTFSSPANEGEHKEDLVALASANARSNSTTAVLTASSPSWRRISCCSTSS